MLKCPVSFCFVGVAPPVIPPVVGIIFETFLPAQVLLGTVVCIGSHFKSLPRCFPGPLAVRSRTIILLAISWIEKLAAMNTRGLFHMPAPFNRMNKSNYMDF
jgi:hypothetical protein